MKSHAPVALLALTAATTVAAAPTAPAANANANAIEQHHGAPSNTAGHHPAASLSAHPAKGDAEPKEEPELTIEWKEFHKELEAEKEKQVQKRSVEPSYTANHHPSTSLSAQDAEPKQETELTIEWKEFHKELEAEKEKQVQKRSAEPASCAGSCPGYCTIL